MNPRDFINFLRSRTGLVLLFLVGLCAALIVANAQRGRLNAVASFNGKVGDTEGDAKKPQLLQSITRDMVPFRPPQPTDKTPAPKSRLPLGKGDTSTPSIPPISIVAETPSQKPKELSEDFVPFGRLIPCELIVTVDSSSINTPIIGLVTEDVYHHGRLVIPANTEVHGTAQVDRMRERIASNGRWNLVWQSGEELAVTGLALDHEEDATGWAITDGSAGLRGRLIKRDDLADLKLFAATLVSGAADAFMTKRSTPLGSYALPSLQNAPLQGAQSVLERYAQQIQQGIERDGFYVRVPAGKQFYLYLTQTLDRADARMGGGSRGDFTDESVTEAKGAQFSPAPQFSNRTPLSPSLTLLKPAFKP